MGLVTFVATSRGAPWPPTGAAKAGKSFEKGCVVTVFQALGRAPGGKKFCGCFLLRNTPANQFYHGSTPFGLLCPLVKFQVGGPHGSIVVEGAVQSLDFSREKTTQHFRTFKNRVKSGREFAKMCQKFDKCPPQKTRKNNSRRTIAAHPDHHSEASHGKRPRQRASQECVESRDQFLYRLGQTIAPR